MRVLICVLALVTVTACGEGYSEMDDRRFQACTDMGGSYYSGDGSKWSCVLPGATHGP